MNTRLNVYGLFAYDSQPTVELLLRDYLNDSNENLIEIARRQLKFAALMDYRDYSAIIVIVGNDGCYVYSRDVLR